MSYYGIDEVMEKINDIEKKIDRIMQYNHISMDKNSLAEERKRNEPEYTYDYYSTYTNDIGGEKRRAEVCKRGDGVWCVEKYINDELMELLPLPGKAEIYAEDAAENFVMLN